MVFFFDAYGNCLYFCRLLLAIQFQEAKKQFMKRLQHLYLLLLCALLGLTAQTQAPDPWVVTAGKIDPANYYGITVANGMIGIVSSPEPFKVKEVVLAGAYDLYGRGRVSNFLRSFNLLNMYLDVDGKRVDGRNTANLQQSLDMREGKFTSSFDVGDKATDAVHNSLNYLSKLGSYNSSRLFKGSATIPPSPL